MQLFDQTKALEGNGYAISRDEFEANSSSLSLISNDNTQPPSYIIDSSLDLNSTLLDSSDDSSFGLGNGFENNV